MSEATATKPHQFETLTLHAGQTVDPTTKSRAVPIHQTTSYVFDDTAHAARLFGLQEFGNIYTRIMNPTTDVLEQRLAALEGGTTSIATASGQAAATLAILNVAGAGDEIISSTSLYGGTYNLFHYTLPKLGITVRFVDPKDPSGFEAAINAKTKLIFAESVGNPKLDVFPFDEVAKIAQSHGVPIFIDNTLPTPYLLKPFDLGANVIIHSTTKFIGGHGTAIGGAIVDGGRFDWTARGRFGEFTEPDPSYHGLEYARAFGNQAYIVKARVQLLRDVGAALSPFNAWLLLQGLETLGVRIERHVANAQAVAEFLYTHPTVASVSYPGLPGDPAHDRARKYLPKGAGSILTFRIHGDGAEAKRTIDRLRLFSLLANVGDAKSLVIHPASTTHQQLAPHERLQSAVDESTIRLSVGIEDVRDIIADLAQALG